jgi:hypothetical protein
MSILDLTKMFADNGITIMYRGFNWLLTDDGRRYYRTNRYLGVNDGMAWEEDKSFALDKAS